VLTQLLALLVPPACLACREPVPRARDALCALCRDELPWLPAQSCPRCALPRPCAPCPARRAAFHAAWAPLAHDGAARALVAALKFRATLAVADLMAAQIAARLPPALRAPGTVLVPVPAGRSRRRARGFDQAQLLARRLSHRTALPVERCLERGGEGAAARQLGASRAIRRQAGRLDVRCRGRPPERVLLVDDVHTTGATLDACARTLRAAGSRFVGAVTYTRALP